MKKILITLTILIINLIITNPANAIKIGLLTNVEEAGIGVNVNGRMIDVNTNKTVCTADAMRGYVIVPYKNAIVLRTDSYGYVSTKGKWYHGKLMVKNVGGKLIVINDIDLESYLKGVVPSEMPASWEFEALKAQAIAARSFALANLGKQAKYGYDLKDNTEDQAYGGASAETNITNKAVDETHGLVLTYDMKIISAYYSASAGGMTSSSVWGGYAPYLHSVPSFDDNVAKNGHGVGMSQHGANNLAKQGYNAYQILQYFYSNVKFAKLNKDT